MAGNPKNDDATWGCIIHVIIGLILMPVVGLYLIASKDPEKKFWGWVLLVVGIVFLAVLGVGRS